MKTAARRLAAWTPYVVFLVNAYCLFVQTPDDAFITYRYAWNLAAGNGPVFNLGDPVEGCSSPLHLLLSSGFMALSGQQDILFVAKVAGILFALGTLAVMLPIGRNVALTGGEILAAQVLVALNQNFAASAVNGLETSLYCLAVGLAVWRFQVELRAGRGWLSGLLVFVALSTRPDALLLFAALAACRTFFYYWPRPRMPRNNFFAPWLFAFLVPTAVLFVARLHYYGYPFPNTYYAKDVSPLFGVQQGIRYLSKALTVRTNHLFYGVGLPTKLLLSLSVPVFWLPFLAGAGYAWRKPSCWALLAVVAANVAFILKSGGDWMQGWRFCVPALPFMALIQVFGARLIAARWTRLRSKSLFSRRARFVSVALAGFFALIAVVGPHRPWHDAAFTTSGRGLLAASGYVGVSGLNQVTVGAWMAEHLPRGASVAYSEMGYAGMVNLDKHFVDVFGLVTKEIAHGAPRELKRSLGVEDKRWFEQDSPVGAVLLKLRPRYILRNCPREQFRLAGYEQNTTLPSSVTNGLPLCQYELTTSAAPR